MMFEDGFMTLLGIDEFDVFYGMNTYTKEIFRFRKDLQPSFVIELTESLAFNRYSFSKNQLAIGSDHPNLEVMIFDTLGQLLNTYKNELSGISVNDIELTDNGLAVSGIYQSGPTAINYPDFMYDHGREEGWFRFNSNTAGPDSTKLVSLAITNIEQLELPEIDSFFSSGPEPGTLYNIIGGRFRIQVSNSGEEEINSFSLNTIFNYRTNFWFCGPVSASNMYFENQNIAPGESAWVEFAGLLALDQKTIPPQFCFWTSAPDSLPDQFPEDDLFCIDNLVNTNSVSQNLFSISPNPASMEFTIQSDGDLSKAIPWKLVDVYGRTIESGQINSQEASETVDVSNVSAGLYYFISEMGSSTLVIQR
jgi:hypothetical protein